jgi:hypothetical protein
VRVEQQQWSAAAQWGVNGAPSIPGAQLVMVFGGAARLIEAGVLDQVAARYPGATLFGCSTAGEIAGTTVSDDTVVATALQFEGTDVRLATTPVAGEQDSLAAGQRLGLALVAEGLTHVFVLSDGLVVNGSQLAEGMANAVGAPVVITGGLAGDGTHFARTFVVAGREAKSGIVAAVGLYGSRLRVGCASLGGWDSFGPERLVTRSRGNVLYELDGQSALALYKRYLGEHARELPASGLLFPLAVRQVGFDEPIVRTILSVDEAEQSLTFAGDLPEGSHARLMKANFDRLIDGATDAAVACRAAVDDARAEFALLISCVGRKLVLKQRTEEEVEAVRDVIGPQAAMAGFYSYGELSPFTPGGQCRLHNQTMTITTLSEA